MRYIFLVPLGRDLGPPLRKGARKAKETKEAATADVAKRRGRDSAAKAKNTAAAMNAAKRQAAEEKETKLQAAKAKEDAAR